MSTTPIRTPTNSDVEQRRPAARKRDAVRCAVEIGQIATGQKADDHPIPQEDSILRALFEEENKRKNSNWNS